VTDESRPLSPGSFLVSVIDGGLSAVARRPLKVRARVSLGGVARGQIDVLLLELGDVQTDKLEIHRLLVRATDAHITVGVRPRLQAVDVGVKVTILQDAIDRWIKATRIPARLHLSADGVVATMDVRGKVVTEVVVDIAVSGSVLVLRPVRAAILGRGTPVLRGAWWYLPLRLPAGASLSKVEHGSGSVTAYLRLPDVDEAVDAAAARRLGRHLAPMLLSLGGSAVRAAARPR
jgi:hypothetical protein